MDLKHYDQPTSAAIAGKLNLDPTRELGRQLESHRISLEAFVTAFLTAAQSFTDMMADLLVFFESAGATYSSTGKLRISFDFGRNAEGLGFDLSSFREWEWQWRKRTSDFTEGVPAWNYDYLRSFSDVLQHPNGNSTPPRFDVAAWFAEYERGRWPRRLPGKPMFSAGRFSHVLRLVWDLWSRIVVASATLGRSRSVLGTYRWAASTVDGRSWKIV